MGYLPWMWRFFNRETLFFKSIYEYSSYRNQGRTSCFLNIILQTICHLVTVIWALECLNCTLYLCFIIFQMPASSIPDTLLELGAAPGCQRKYQQAFMGSADYSPATQPPQPLSCTGSRPPLQTSSTAHPHQPKRPRCFASCSSPLISWHQKDLAFLFKVKKKKKKQAKNKKQKNKTKHIKPYLEIIRPETREALELKTNTHTLQKR